MSMISNRPCSAKPPTKAAAEKRRMAARGSEANAYNTAATAISSHAPVGASVGKAVDRIMPTVY